MVVDPTQRFSSRVENYVKYRPHYPAAVLDLLHRECELTPASVIADIGSGTGISAELFLAHGNPVYGVEPNAEMRAAAEHQFAGNSRFISAAARAEATTLPDACADFVVAGQAFHWFDAPAARTELRRILKPAGWVVLMWNERRFAQTPFDRAYEHLLRTYGTDYAEVVHRRTDQDATFAFFAPGGCQYAAFPNEQTFDFAGLRGRLLSSSYIPGPDQPAYEPMLAELRRIFDAYQTAGRIDFGYETHVYYGHLT